MGKNLLTFPILSLRVFSKEKESRLNFQEVKRSSMTWYRSSRKKKKEGKGVGWSAS